MRKEPMGEKNEQETNLDLISACVEHVNRYCSICQESKTKQRLTVKRSQVRVTSGKGVHRKSKLKKRPNKEEKTLLGEQLKIFFFFLHAMLQVLSQVVLISTNTALHAQKGVRVHILIIKKLQRKSMINP